MERGSGGARTNGILERGSGDARTSGILERGSGGARAREVRGLGDERVKVLSMIISDVEDERR